MIQADDSTADASARRVIVRCNERTHTGIRTEYSCICELRSKLLTLTKKEIHLIRSNFHIIDLVIRKTARCGSDETDCISRHEDIGICRLTASVYHKIVDPVTENKKSTLRREHVDSSSCHLCNMVSPDTSGIDYQTASESLLFLCMYIIDLNTDNSVSFLHNRCHFMISEDVSSMKTSIKDIGHGKSERIHSTVRNLYSTYKALVH